MVYERATLLHPINRFKAIRFKKMKSLKLNNGCGKAKLLGWLNIDTGHSIDLVIDVRRGLPFNDNSGDFVYSEHVLEHLTFKEGEKVLRESCIRYLNAGRVLKIAMPNLEYIIYKYNADWKNQDWLSCPNMSS